MTLAPARLEDRCIELSQHAVLRMEVDGEAYVVIPLEGIPDGALLHEETARHGYEPLEDGELPWVYLEYGVLISCRKLEES